MTISELIAELELHKKQAGDVRVIVDTLSHSWPPDLALRQRGNETVLVLNS